MNKMNLLIRRPKPLLKRFFSNEIGKFQTEVAITREIDEKILEQALCMDPKLRNSISLELAKKQHEDLIQAIKNCGVKTIHTLQSNGFPDSVFIEDTAVIANKTVLISRPGAMERRGETEAVKSLFNERFSHLTMKEVMNGTLDGGDVLFTGEELIVGETKRTNKQGILSLQFAFPSIPVYYVNLESLSWNAGMEHTPLHLKSFCSLLAPHHVIVGDNIGTELMKWFRNRTAQRDSAMSLIKQFPEFQSQTKQIAEIEETFAKKYASQYLFVCVPDQEAANCVYINQTVLRRSGKEFPESGKIFERVKLPQIEIDASELSKVDGAITCCSLLF